MDCKLTKKANCITRAHSERVDEHIKTVRKYVFQCSLCFHSISYHWTQTFSVT